MLIAVLGVLLVGGGLYLITRTSSYWHELYMLVVQLASVLPAHTWDQVQYFVGVGSLLTGSLLVLLRLFGVVKRI